MLNQEQELKLASLLDDAIEFEQTILEFVDGYLFEALIALVDNTMLDDEKEEIKSKLALLVDAVTAENVELTKQLAADVINGLSLDVSDINETAKGLFFKGVIEISVAAILHSIEYDEEPVTIKARKMVAASDVMDAMIEAYERTYVDPSTGTPVVDPSIGVPVVVDPSTGNPIVDPSTGTPIVIDPSIGIPVIVDPSTGNGVIDPSTGRPVIVDPSTGTPVIGDPSTGLPDVDPSTGTTIPADPSLGRSVVVDPASGKPLVIDPTSGLPVIGEFGTGNLVEVVWRNDPRRG